MHPGVGPWREANHLYVDQSGLAVRLTEPGPPLVLLDAGLGAATNAVAALTCARALGPAQQRELHVWSLETTLAPVRLALEDAAGFPFLQPFAAAVQQLLRDDVVHLPRATWRLVVGDMAEAWRRADLPAAHVVFFDPFSPAANPQLWTPAALRLLRARCDDGAEGCALYTYSASTPTRVSFLLGGFFVGAGVSVGTRRETTVAATRPGLLRAPLGERWMARWERSSARAPHGQPLTDEVERALRDHPQFHAGTGQPTFNRLAT
ncbi:MAG: methyltransferase [Deltaproteobacteria bacterium]|nr:methyltransferase [Deltaproteobacteria bacterium]